MRKAEVSLGALAILALGGCVAAPPSGPDVMVLPGNNKTYADFQQDDYSCRGAAAQSIGYGSPAEAANQSAVGSAAVGTAVGAAAGAAIGAASGNAGAGAAIGAGSGLLMGTAVGAGNAQVSAGTMQRRYDVTYVQCMAAKGNKVPDMLPSSAAVYPLPGPDYYPYAGYPPVYGYYPGYGYLYPPVTVFYGWGARWGGRHYRRR